MLASPVQPRGSTLASPTCPPSPKTIYGKKAAKEDFDIVRLIGEGAHAKVFEVVRKGDSKTLAMKVMNKEEIINLGQVIHATQLDGLQKQPTQRDRD